MKTQSKVIFHIPNLLGGGAERVASEIARYLNIKEIDVIFFVHDVGNSYPLPKNIKTVVANKKGHIGRVLELCALIDREMPVAILSFLPYANLISLFAKSLAKHSPRLILSEHQPVSMIRETGGMEWLKRMLRRYLYRKADSIVAVSRGVADDLECELKGVAEGQIIVINNPCYIEGARKYTVESAKYENNILAVGRLIDEKGFDVLIRAFARVKSKIKSVKLTIAGEGPERSNLERLIRQLGLSSNVELPGFSNKIHSFYEKADLFVCSSKYEGFGNVIVEAMSFGLPIVSTDCPHGPREILDYGRFGRLVAVGDEGALAKEIIASLGSSTDQRAQIEYAQKFSLDVIGEQYIGLLGLQSDPEAGVGHPSGYLS